MLRVNTRISKEVNDWLDERSKVTGVPKSTLIFLALEQYIQQHKAMETMQGMEGIMAKLEQLAKGQADATK